MERRFFLKLPLLAPTLSPVVNLPIHQLKLNLPKKGILVRAGEDRSNKPFKWLDASFTVKVSGKDTEGRYVIFDTSRPEKVPPPSTCILIVTNGSWW